MQWNTYFYPTLKTLVVGSGKKFHNSCSDQDLLTAWFAPHTKHEVEIMDVFQDTHCPET